VKITHDDKAVMSAFGPKNSHAVGLGGAVPPSPWRCRIQELAGIAGSPALSWGFAAQGAFVGVVQLLNELAGLNKPCEKLRDRLATLLGDLGEQSAGAHADADFIVEADGAITVTANIDEVQCSINRLDAAGATASRHRRGMPPVVVADRSSGEVSEVKGLHSVFFALAHARAAAHEATDVSAWLTREERLNAMCKSGQF
jgi:hypothetical protein